MPITATTGALTYNKTPITDDWTYWYLRATSGNSSFTSIAVHGTDLYVTDPDGSLNTNESYYYQFNTENKFPKLLNSFGFESNGMYSFMPTPRPPGTPPLYGVYYNKISLDNNGTVYLYGSQKQNQTTTSPSYEWSGAVTARPSSLNTMRGASGAPERGRNNLVIKYVFDSNNNPWTITKLQTTLSQGQPSNGYSDFGPYVSRGGNYTDPGDYLGQGTNAGVPLQLQAAGEPTGLSASTTGLAFSACYVDDIYSATANTPIAFLTYHNTTTSINPPALDRVWQVEFVNQGQSYGLVSDSADNVYVIIGTKLAKYNSTGTQQWVKTVTNMNGGELAIDSNDDIYWTSGPYIVKLDSSGTLIWARQLNKTIADFQILGTNMYMCGFSYIINLPTDGTLTGTYDDLIYSVITPTVSASSLTGTITAPDSGNTTSPEGINANKSAIAASITTVSFPIA